MDASIVKKIKRPEVIKVILNPKPKTSTIDGQIVGFSSLSRLFPSCSLCIWIDANAFGTERKEIPFGQSNIKRSPMPSISVFDVKSISIADVIFEFNP